MVLIASCALAVGCGSADADAEAEARAQLEAEFGRRDPSSTTVASADARAPDSPAPEPSEPGPAAGRPRGPAAGPPASRRGTSEEGEPDERAAEAEAEGVAIEDSAPAGADPDRAVAGVDLDSLLAVADRAYARLTSLRAEFTQRIENPLIGRTREGRGVWYQAGRGFFRMDFDDPPEDVYVADGVCLWLYEPSLHPTQVGASPLEGGTEIGSVDILGRLLSEARTRYEGVYQGLVSLAGTSTHHVLLTPRGPSQYVDVQVWIAESDRLVRRFRIEEENQTVRTVTLSSLEPQIAIADSVFRFTPPDGVSVFGADGRCG